MVLLVPPHGSGDLAARRADLAIDAARAAIRAGEVERARHLARGGRAVYAGSRSRWLQALRVLEAEVAIADQKPRDALAALSAGPLPADAELAARWNLQLGIANLRVGREADAARLLDRAAELTRSAAVRLDIGVARAALLARAAPAAQFESAAARTIAGARAAGLPYPEAAVLINWSYHLIRRGEYERAAATAQQAVAAADRAGARRLHGIALVNQALSLREIGDLEGAVELLRKAGTIQERARLEGDLNQTLGETGNTYLALGKANDAAPLFRRAWEIAARRELKLYAALWAGNLAGALSALGQWDEAARWMETARAGKREVGEEDSTVWLDLTAVEIAAGRGDFGAAERAGRELVARTHNNPPVRWQAEAVLARLYRRAGRDAAADTHFRNALGIIEATRASLQATDYRLTFLSRLIRFYREYVAYLLERGEAERALAAVESSRGRVLLEQTGAGGGGWPAGGYSRLARDGRILLSYWLAPEGSYAWRIARDGVRLFRLPASVEADARQYAAAIASPAELNAEAHAAGRRLYEALIVPAAIPAGAKVVIAPDGVLHGLNFEALPARDGRAWIEHATVEVAPSLNALGAAGGDSRVRGAGDALLIGDPEFDTPEFPRLRWAGQEIDAVRQALRGRRVSALTGAQATPEAWGAAGPGRFSLIHFTAHGVANARRPLDSAVLLTPAGGGGRLRARDVEAGTISADLVTLSSCRSAGARDYAGEGLVGFAWAFLHAGARRVVAGLWDVGDRSTAELMPAMYRHLRAGRTPGGALREAKLEMLKRPGVYRRPFYWAPFQVYTRVL